MLRNATTGVNQWIIPRPYLPGDTITGNCMIGGYLTSSSLDYSFTIPLIRPVEGVSDCTFDKLVLTVRQNGAYLMNRVEMKDKARVSTWPSVSFTSGVNIVVTASSAASNNTNNAPIGLLVEYSLTFK